MPIYKSAWTPVQLDQMKTASEEAQRENREQPPSSRR